jgi:hypothetical protein
LAVRQFGFFQFGHAAVSTRVQRKRRRQAAPRPHRLHDFLHAAERIRPQQFPVTLGGDFSGVVEAVGPGVANFKTGDEVYGQASAMNGGSGSFAEIAIAPSSSTAAKPRSIDHTRSSRIAPRWRQCASGSD